MKCLNKKQKRLKSISTKETIHISFNFHLKITTFVYLDLKKIVYLNSRIDNSILVRIELILYSNTFSEKIYNLLKSQNLEKDVG